MIPSCKKANTVSHSEFVAFVRDFLKILETEAHQNQAKMLEMLSEWLSSFEATLGKLLIEPPGKQIDFLEGERFRLWETIADRLDDNMQVDITDKAYILDGMGLTEEDAVMEIPEYKATCELLLPNTRRKNAGFFPTRGAKDGHFWDVKDMDELIFRLIDPLNAQLCDVAGVADQIAELCQVEQKLDESIKRLSDRMLVEQVRDQRHKVVVLITMFKLGGIKKKRRVDAFDLYENRLKQKEHIRRLEMFSTDQLTPGAFLKALHNTVAPWSEPNAAIDVHRKKMLSKYEEFCELMGTFQNHYLWDRFDSLEGELYRSAIILMDAVSIHLPCFGAESEELWESHCAKKSYKAAMDLLGMLNDTPYRAFARWTPDQLVGFPAMIKILTQWGCPENRRLLRDCGAQDKYDTFCNLDRKVYRMAEEILSQTPPDKLVKLRVLRYELSLMGLVSKGRK